MWFSRLSALLRRRALDDRAKEELEFHLGMETEENMRRGMAPVDARAAARRKVGNITQVREQVHRMNTILFLEETSQDVRFSLRTWRQNPGFAFGVISVLVLGLGSATALFSVVDRILFRPFPYSDPDRLVSFGEVFPTYGNASPREIMRDRAYFQIWHPVPEPFQAVTSILGFGGVCDLTEERPERLNCARVESNFFDVLGVPVFLGSHFSMDDDQKGAPLVAIITHAFWKRRFGGDPGSVGRSLQIDGKSVRIRGVLRPDFEPPLGEPDIFLPQQLGAFDPNQTFTRFFTAIGRLKPGITPEQATAAIAPLIDAGAKQSPQQIKGPITARVRKLRDFQAGDASRMAWLILACGTVFLIIVCVNATGLLLARFAARAREFEMRTALGASKARLARLALAESLSLATIAGVLGLSFAWALLRIFQQLAPASIPKIQEAGLDFRVFSVVAALSLACGVVVGFWPAVSSLRAGSLPTGSRATSSLKPRVRLALITTQIALTVALLGTSGLLLRSLWNLIHVPLGFDSEQTVAMTITLNAARYPSPEKQTALFEQVLERVQAYPETIAATWSNISPLSMYAVTSGFPVDGASKSQEAGNLRVRYVTPGYFETFRIPIVKGRTFVKADREEQPVAILSQAAERILFPGRSSIGHTIQFSERWHQVVGVIKDIRNAGLTHEGEAEVYLILERKPESMRAGMIALRTSLNSTNAAALLKQSLADVDPQLPSEIKTLSELVATLTARPRFLAALLLAFAGFALLVASAGLYAVASFLVTQRTKDIGVRIALGASPSRIAKQVVGEAIYWIVAGTALGYLLAQLAARLLSSELFQIAGSDSFSWVASISALLLAVGLALVTPMRRASSIDPVIALRAE